MNHLPYAITAWLFFIGLYGIVTSRNLIHMVTCLSVVQSSTYVILLSIGYRSQAAAPIFSDKPVGTPAVDPVVQALTLTDIVVGATIMALLLVLTLHLHRRRETIDPEQLSPLHKK